MAKKKKDKKLKSFYVTFTKSEFHTYQVEAETEEEASEMADTYFNSGDWQDSDISDYTRKHGSVEHVKSDGLPYETEVEAG